LAQGKSNRRNLNIRDLHWPALTTKSGKQPPVFLCGGRGKWLESKELHVSTHDIEILFPCGAILGSRK
jgi:hypothetical protein